MSEILEVIERIIEELRAEGMNPPDIMLAGPQFIEYSKDALKQMNLKIYRIEELGYDAVIADSNYLGQIKKASRRVSVEPPLLEEKEVWNELKKLDV
ncbi:family 4B encapsulin nanocompartment shell protein [Thermococcus peptonophilus]|uniref:family 4B encapsulin nanocompartment shell protein n=1 Tax=Thermococcus peptonophilus TaxID=53952 RepID=UPI0006D1599A